MINKSLQDSYKGISPAFHSIVKTSISHCPSTAVDFPSRHQRTCSDNCVGVPEVTIFPPIVILFSSV